MAKQTEAASAGEIGAWLVSARHTQDRLAALVASLGERDLVAPSYCRDWTIAQVLSHLGSQAEILTKVLSAGLAGGEPPGRETMEPIWADWNARTPSQQAVGSVETNEGLVERLESLGDAERLAFRVPMFGRELDFVGLLRTRQLEQTMHAWDVAVAVDPAARLDPEAVQLLVDGVPELAARLGKPAAHPTAIAVTTTGPPRSFRLDTGGVHLDPGDGAPGGSLDLTAEALLRLVYGRLDEAHAGSGEVRVDGVTLEDLRAIFPGF